MRLVFQPMLSQSLRLSSPYSIGQCNRVNPMLVMNTSPSRSSECFLLLTLLIVSPFVIQIQRLRLYRPAIGVLVATVRTGTSAAFEAAAVFLLDSRAVVRGSDLVVGHRVVMIDTRTVRHQPVPTVRAALADELDPLTAPPSHRDFTWDEPSTSTHVFGVAARKR